MSIAIRVNDVNRATSPVHVKAVCANSPAVAVGGLHAKRQLSFKAIAFGGTRFMSALRTGCNWNERTAETKPSSGNKVIGCSIQASF